MKKILITFATLISGIAIVLAMDLGRFAFKYIDVEGHELRMMIRGHGSPAVVFETGGSGAAGGPLEAWARVQPGVSKFTCTVTYDRAGIGRSPPGPAPRDARQIARELHLALRNAHVAPPYVLVGHSLGGPYIRVFAGMYPDEVAGLVLADPTQEEFMDWNMAQHPDPNPRQGAEWNDIQASLREAHESRVPPGIPVALITAMGPRVFPDFVTEMQKQEMKTLKPVWLKFHQAWLDKLPNAQHIITENSSHAVPFEEPELIVKAIKDVVNRPRLPSDSKEAVVPAR